MHIAVVGGGFCGALVAKKLQHRREVQVTLIDRTAFFEYTPGIHRLVCEPHRDLELTVSYRHFLPHARIVTGNVVRMTPCQVETSKERVRFDRAVVATGVEYPVLLDDTTDGFTLTSVEEALALAEALRGADTVLIVGGGLVGTELAGELGEKMPDLEVTVVHSHDRLLERNPPSASRHARRFLERKGARLVLGERVVDQQGDVFVTDADRGIGADLAVWCTGIRHNPGFLAELSGALDEQRAVQVNRYLQLPAHPHIFAGGDVTDIREEKTAQNAERHARVISRNILRYPAKTLIPYRRRPTALVISLGGQRGILSWQRISINGRLPGGLKKLVRRWALHGYR